MRALILLLGLLIYPILCAFVAWKFGRIDGVRFIGIGLLLVWLAMVTATRLFLRIEERQMAAPRGWVKILAVLPLLVIGILVVMYPQEAACVGGIHLRGC